MRPGSLREALDLRAKLAAVPFAGGTDLMVRLRRGAGALPAFTQPVLFLDQCPELSTLTDRGDVLEVGAMVTLATLLENELVNGELRCAVQQMGGPALRTVATLGGNICNASPAGDALPFLYAFGARARIASNRKERVLSVEELIMGPGKTCLRPDELLISILIPTWKPSVSLWRKVGTRKANALTKVSIAAFADVEAGCVTRARLALGAVGPTVVRVREAEWILEGASVAGSTATADRARLAGRVQEAARAAVRPIDDQRSTAEYRREVAGNLAASFVERLFAGQD